MRMAFTQSPNEGVHDSGTTARDVAIVLGCALVLACPIIARGLPLGQDAAWHVTWYRRFAEQFWAGELYPRWLLGMNEGLGAPTFFVYSPLPFWVASLMRPLAPFAASGQRELFELGLMAALGLIASGLTAYVWLSGITSRLAAVLGALAYMVLPYHLLDDLYVRAACPEFWSFVWMPLLLYYARAVVRGRGPAIAGLAVCYALLVTTHLFVTMLFSPVLLAYVLCQETQASRWTSLRHLLSGMALGLALSGAYLLPALAHEQHYSVRVHNALPGFDYKANFLALDQASGGLLPVTLFNAVVAVWGFLKARGNAGKPARIETRFWLFVAAATVLLMFPLSKPLWNVLPILQAIQFPWRWNAILSVAATALLAIGIQNILRTASRRRVLLLSLPPVLLLGVALPVLWQHSHRSAVPIGAVAACGYDHYLPVWSKVREPDAAVLARARTGERIEVAEGQAAVKIRLWAPRHIQLEAQSAHGAGLKVKQLFYPGWTATLDAGSASLNVKPSFPDGLIGFWVPEGDHAVTLTLNGGWSETFGWGVTAASALFLAAACLIQSCRHRRRRTAAAMQETPAVTVRNQPPLKERLPVL